MMEEKKVLGQPVMQTEDELIDEFELRIDWCQLVLEDERTDAFTRRVVETEIDVLKFLISIERSYGYHK